MILTTDDKEIKFPNRESQTLKLTAHGLTPDEIGDLLGISRETVRKVLCNIKLKLKLQKSTELVAFYWCTFFGTSLIEQRNNILKTLMCICFLITLPNDYQDKRRIRLRVRREGIETIEIYPTI